MYTGTPTVQWVDGAGDVVPDTTAVSSHVSVDEGGVIVVLSFPSLSHDHMGRYTCVADVNLTVSPFQITKSQTSTITPGIEILNICRIYFLFHSTKEC